MGFTGLACWVNAPQNGIEIIREHIIKNHSGQVKGRWYLQVRSYRSVLDGQRTRNEPPRSMVSVTMNDAAFVLIDDPAVPPSELSVPPSPDVPLAAFPPISPPPSKPITSEESRSHRRSSFVTIRPPESLELLLLQLKARWVPVRQSGGGATTRPGAGAPQVTIEGFTFVVGTDWIVRAGNVIIAGGAIRGMLLEAEYLPLPSSPEPVLAPNDTADMLSNLLTSLLPSTSGSKTIVFPITDAHWNDVLFDTDDRSEEDAANEENVYIDGEQAVPRSRKGDWTGTYRDQRSAYLIIGALKTEGIL